MATLFGSRRSSKILVVTAATAWLMISVNCLNADTVVDSDGRTWGTLENTTTAQYDPPQMNEYFATGQDPLVTGRFTIDSVMATAVTIAVGDTISYDYTLTNEQRNFRGYSASNWVGDSFGDFRGGVMTEADGFGGSLTISGRLGYQFDFATDRTLYLAGAPNEPGVGGGTEDGPGIHVVWTFPTANTYQVTVTNIGWNVPLANFAGSTGDNPVTAITFFRQGLWDSEQDVTVTNFAQSSPGSLVFGFEGGITTQGFKDLTAAGSETNWVSTSATIDIGDGFSLLAATEGSDRVVVAPYDVRDNFGHANHRSLVLRSPAFELDGSGSLQVDMMGGMKYGENANTLDPFLSDPVHVGELGTRQRNVSFDFSGAGEVDDGEHIQGFALRNALTGQYVLVGSSTATNDGKMRSSDPFDRGAWNQVGFTAEQLAPFVNDGNRYEIDFFDSFGESSWGWIGFDNLRVPGTLSPFQKGDTNGDNDVDSGDSSTVFANFTGARSASPVAKSDGLARIHGDFDGNGDVDGGDVVEHIANIGLTAPTSGAAKLLYDPSDGSVSLNADGADGNVITTFRLLSDTGALATGVAAYPTSANPLITDLATELFWADTDLNGFAGIQDLGAILASGLTLTGVQQALSSALYVGTAGTGAFDFNIVLALGGDYNNDGSVDAADYVVWRKNGGSPEEYNEWRANFGKSLENGAAAGESLSSGTVPEPSSLMICGLLIAYVAAGRIRRSVSA